jgi:hypothetical protein
VKAARDGGAVVLALGLFINSIISFLIVSAALFFIARKNRRPLCPPPRYDGWEIRDLLWR